MKKGVILETKGRKSVVLFNDGSAQMIKTPRGCSEGSVVSVSYNTPGIVRLAVLCALVFTLCFFSARYIYFTPVGYVEIAYTAKHGTEETFVLTCNRFERVLAAYPPQNITVLNKTIDDASEAILTLFNVPPSAPLQVNITGDGETRTVSLRNRLNQLRVNHPQITFDFSQPVLHGKMIQERLKNMRERMQKNRPNPPEIIIPDIKAPGIEKHQENKSNDART